MGEHKPTIRLKCSGVPYRQGFIEVTPAIHEGYVNIETWDINPSVDLESLHWVSLVDLADDDVSSNTEVEMTIVNAKKLATAINDAIDRIENDVATPDCSPVEWRTCDECRSKYILSASWMTALCPECAFQLYGYKNCEHRFESERCVDCGWDGSVSEYVKTLIRGDSSEMGSG